MPNFDLGKLVMTRGINDKITAREQFSKEIMTALQRYLSHDWGDLCVSDRKLNDSALETGEDRILASYGTSEGKVYIITEWDRSYTTILFASEY